MTDRKKVNLPYLFNKVHNHEPITWLTCYDYPTAYLQEQAGMDMILVGDSLAMTMLGYETTLPATMDDMIRHSAAVRRGAPNVFIVGDMPYMSYQPSVESAIRNAGRFMAEASCDSIKLEGGVEMADRIQGIVNAGIPAMGHLGLTPQSASALGGYKVQGRAAKSAKKIIDAAKALEQAGAFAVLLGNGPRPRLQDHHRAGRKLHHHEPGLRSARPRSALDLPRYVWSLPSVQTAHGQGIRQRRRGHLERAQAICPGSHRTNPSRSRKTGSP